MGEKRGSRVALKLVNSNSGLIFQNHSEPDYTEYMLSDIMPTETTPCKDSVLHHIYPSL
jgi:hypothetical protein